MPVKAEALAKRNGKKIATLLREVAEACKADGLGSPRLFFEPESNAIFVLDGDHPNYQRDCGPGQRQQAIVVRIPLGDIGTPFDAGAW